MRLRIKHKIYLLDVLKNKLFAISTLQTVMHQLICAFSAFMTIEGTNVLEHKQHQKA